MWAPSCDGFGHRARPERAGAAPLTDFIGLAADLRCCHVVEGRPGRRETAGGCSTGGPAGDLWELRSDQSFDMPHNAKSARKIRRQPSHGGPGGGWPCWRTAVGS
jgi:hypothetical protein